MDWRIEYTPKAKKDLDALDRDVARRIAAYLRQRVAAGNPREQGIALTGELRELWRYRVGAYRVLCHIEDRTVTVLVVRIGHRGKIYRDWRR